MKVSNTIELTNFSKFTKPLSILCNNLILVSFIANQVIKAQSTEIGEYNQIS